jgi:hypothetical protein
METRMVDEDSVQIARWEHEAVAGAVPVIGDAVGTFAQDRGMTTGALSSLRSGLLDPLIEAVRHAEDAQAGARIEAMTAADDEWLSVWLTVTCPRGSAGGPPGDRWLNAGPIGRRPGGAGDRHRVVLEFPMTSSDALPATVTAPIEEAMAGHV